MIYVGQLRYSSTETRWRDIQPMIRAATLWSICVVLLFGTSVVLAQDAPPLEGPISAPEPAKTNSPPRESSAEKPPATNSGVTNTRAQPRSMLIIPGVTAPAGRKDTTARTQVGQPAPSTNPSSAAPQPILEAPATPSNVASPFRAENRAPTEANPGISLAEPIPLDLEPLQENTGAAQTRIVPPSPRTGSARPRASGPNRPAEDVPVETRPASRRMPGFLGRLLGQPPPEMERRGSLNTQKSADQAKSKSDPKLEPDAALRRRIEQQIRNTLGDKVQSVEVRVSGRNVLIAARATRFWQKRSVYRSIESIPALAGLRVRIQLDD
jgi:hypothetical protein